MKYKNNARQMKTHRLLFLAFFLTFSPISLRAQEVVHTGDLIIEDFGSLFTIPNFTTITRVTGSVILRGGTLTSAPPLATIQTIEGNLEVKGLTSASFTSLTGFLPALTNVGRDVIIQNNAALTRIDGLMVLTSIGGSLQIGGVGDDEGNPVLEVLVGVKGSVMPPVPAVPAFEALTTLGGSLIIANNGVLNNSPLFDNLPSIGGSLRIQNNAMIPTLPSINMLATIGADFHIEDMPLPTALPDYPLLTSVGGNIVLRNNAALSSCCSFLEILNSPSGTVNITGNAIGCESRSGVSDNCYTGGNLNIDNVNKVPGNIRFITRITGNLIIRGGSHRSFPNFSALTEVTGGITVQDIHTVSGSPKRPPAGDGGLFNADNIFPELESVGGNIVFERNYNIGRFRDVFNKLRRIGGVLRFGASGSGGGTVNANRRFNELTGFSALESIGGFFIFEDREGNTRFRNIANFTTFPSLKNIGADGLTITHFYIELEANGIILFPNLERIGGSLSIESSENGETFPSFPKLRFLGGDIRIANITKLRRISGFNALRFVGGEIRITTGLDELHTVEGFNALETVTGIDIVGHEPLRLVRGFNSLKTITADDGRFRAFTIGVSGLNITQAPRQIEGFESLEFIGGGDRGGGDMSITRSFDRVPDFDKLTRVGRLTITGTLLTALPSFNKIRAPRANNVATIVQNNSSLTDCCAIRHFAGRKTIRNNGVGCRSEEDILSSCLRHLDVPTTIRLPANAGSSDFYVNTGAIDRGVINATPWRLVPEAGASWLSNFSHTADDTNREITFNYAQNTGAERMATITVSNTDTGTAISETITVIQSAANTRELFTPTLIYNLPAESRTRTIEIYSNVPWEITGAPGWLNLNNTSKDGTGMPRFTVSLNTGGQRTARLVLSSTDAGGAPISHTIEVFQAAGAGVARSLVVTPDETIIAHQLATFNDRIRVVSNVPWRASKDVGWITSIRPNSGNAGTTSVTINWNDNPTDSERRGRITFTSNEPGVTEVVTDVVNVSQRGGIPAPFLTVNGEENVSRVQRPSGAGTYTFTVESNRNWRSRKVTSDADWVTLSVQSGSGNTSVVATYEANTGGEPRRVTWRYEIDGVSGIRPQLMLEQLAAGVNLLSINHPEDQVFEYTGGEVEREITSNVSWEVVNSAAGGIPSWLTVDPSMGSNNQIITITCAANTQSTERTVALRVQSRGISPSISTPSPIGFRQAGRPAPALEGPADAITLSPIAGMGAFNVTANTPWKITHSAAWITNINPSTGSANQRVEITFIANPETTERETTLTLSSTTSGVDISRSVVIKQSGATASFLTGPPTIDISADAGSKAFNISSNVDWEIVGNPAWITTFRPQRGNGDATVEFVYQANPNQTERVGMFRLQEVTTSTPVAPAMIEVRQAPKAAVNQRSLSVNPTQNTFPPIMGSVNLTVSSTIPWSATGVPAWVMLSQTSGNADATVVLTYQANAATTKRDAVIMFSNTDTGTSIIRSVNISQEGSTVRTLSVSATQVNLLSAQGSTQLVVSSNIPWVVEEDIAWITLDKNAGTTTETVTVSYEANSASGERSGSITLRNNDSEAAITHTINISQSGAPSRALVVTPTPLSLPPTIGSTVLTVTSTNVDWLIEEDIAWITPDETSGTSSGTVTLTYEANTTANARDGTLTFRSSDIGSPITVVIDISQGGRTSRVLSLNTNRVDLPSTMGSRLLTVNTNIAWLIEGDISWVTADPSMGTTASTVRLTYDANAGASVRSGILTFKSDDGGTVITRRISVTQAGSSTAPPPPPPPPPTNDVLGLPILEEEGIQIFPNPAGNLVHIEGIKGDGQVLTIRSLAGILLRSEVLGVDARGASAIDISDFPRGVYIFTIRGHQGSIIRRLIKQ